DRGIEYAKDELVRGWREDFAVPRCGGRAFIVDHVAGGYAILRHRQVNAAVADDRDRCIADAAATGKRRRVERPPARGLCRYFYIVIRGAERNARTTAGIERDRVARA